MEGMEVSTRKEDGVEKTRGVWQDPVMLMFILFHFTLCFEQDIGTYKGTIISFGVVQWGRNMLLYCFIGSYVEELVQ